MRVVAQLLWELLHLLVLNQMRQTVIALTSHASCFAHVISAHSSRTLHLLRMLRLAYMYTFL